MLQPQNQCTLCYAQIICLPDTNKNCLQIYEQIVFDIYDKFIKNAKSLCLETFSSRR